MDFGKIAEKIAYRYMALNPPVPLDYNAFYSGGIRRGRDYRYEADMNRLFPEAKTGDRAEARCVYLSPSEGTIGMSITLLGSTSLFVNGELLFTSDIFTERNNHIPNRLDIPVKEGINEIELKFKKTALGFGAIFGTHLAKWDYIFTNPNDHSQEGVLYRLNDGEWLPITYKWQKDGFTTAKEADLLNPENISARRLPGENMWIRPYYGTGN